MDVKPVKAKPMISKEEIIEVLHEVKDPEIPTISVVDLGIVSNIEVSPAGDVKITLTPTFAGCPALKLMEKMVAERVRHVEGVGTVEVETTFDNPWNTDKISEQGLLALKKHGLAPPPRHSSTSQLDVLERMACPWCGSTNTSMKTPFGPTLCRSMHYCDNCLQAFESFKPVE
jgi:ring-1,2-phenylacetyl-CoA epoxidase subunit PaaD